MGLFWMYTCLFVCCLISGSTCASVFRKNDRKDDLCPNKDEYAVCRLQPNPGKASRVNGTIYFHQPVNRDCTFDFLSVQINIENVPADDGTRKHGFHVHEKGDMSRGCESMGGHYNPRGARHGSPWNHPGARHIGDFGNVRQRKSNTKIKTRLVDYLASLTGPESIMGRGVVLHAGEDDLGLKARNAGSLRTGNAGGRLACCVIEPSPKIDFDQFSLYR